jgi:hypothetical protein
MGLGALAYGSIFVAFGLEREERTWLTAKMTELWKRRSQMLAAA